MKNTGGQGMTREGALRLEYFIIGLGIFALVLIFQPFSLTLFAIGSVLVVIAGLINNLLPMAQPGVRVRSVITVGMVVAMIFCIVLLVSIAGIERRIDGEQVTANVSTDVVLTHLALGQGECGEDRALWATGAEARGAALN